jgi:hypothetical protein
MRRTVNSNQAGQLFDAGIKTDQNDGWYYATVEDLIEWIDANYHGIWGINSMGDHLRVSTINFGFGEPELIDSLFKMVLKIKETQ